MFSIKLFATAFLLSLSAVLFAEPGRTDLTMKPNEASALVAVDSPALLKANGWTRAWWTICDEGPVEKSLRLIVETKSGDGARKIDIEKVKARTPEPFEDQTDDSEAMARRDGWIYILGSHFGKKTGPLAFERQWVARFREAELADPKVSLEIALDQFLLHRVINDALARSGILLIARGPNEETRMMGPAFGRVDASWRSQIKDLDRALNIEGATFLPNGDLLVGLRFPCTELGHPVAVQIRGIEGLFAKPLVAPTCVGFHTLGNVGSVDKPAGFRDLDFTGGKVHAIVGNLDSDPVKSVLLVDHPAGTAAPCEQVAFAPAPSGGSIDAKIVRSLPPGAEGISVSADGNTFIVLDDKSATPFLEF